MADRPQQIFLSYSREDVAFARELRDWLLDQGQQPWMDLFDIPAGARWPDEIDRALRNSDVVLGVLSPASLASENVKNEWDWAIARKKRFVLLMVESCELPFHYVSINYLDFATDRQGAFEALHRSLAQPRDDEEPEQPRPSTHVRPVRRPLRPAGEMVGRERELAQLREQLGAAMSGQGSLILIGGEAGIGKTTLTAAIAAEAEDRGALVLLSGCYDLTTTLPYGPWVEIFRGYPEDEHLPAMPEQLREGTGMEGIGSQAQLFDLVTGFLSEIAAERPLLLLLEDLHWADMASLDLLRYLGRLLAGQRMLIIGTYRDDELTRRHELYQLLPVLTRESQAQRILLHRLDVEAVDTLLATRYSLPSEDRARLAAHLLELSEGNPFFAGELLRSLEEEAILSETDGSWQLGQLSAISIPPVVREVIEGRLSRLDDESRSALEVAAVIGQMVPFDLWQAAMDLSEDALFGIVEQALEQQLLTESGGDRLTFSHALIRETLYDGVMNLRRRRMHRQIGELLAKSSRPDPDEVANHFVQANAPEAPGWLIRAGERAQQQYAWLIAVGRYQHAADLLPDDGSESRQLGWLQYRIGMLLRASDRERGLQALSSAEEQGHASGDALLVACSLGTQGLLLCQGGMLGPGLVKMREGVDQIVHISDTNRESQVAGKDIPEALLPRADDPTVGVIGPASLSEWLALAGYYREAIELGEAFIGRLDQLPTEKNVVPLWAGHYPDVFQGLSVAYAMTGHPETARTWSERAQAEYLRMGHLIMVAAEQYNLLNMVIMGYGADRLEERRELARKLAASWQKATTHRIHHREVQDPTSVLISLVEGDWQRASANATWWATQAGGVGFRNQATVVSGRIAHYQGRFIDAWEQVRKVLPEGLETPLGSVEYFPGLLAIDLTASLALDQGDIAAALPWLELHEKWLDWADAAITRPDASLHRARYWLMADDVGEARCHAEESLEFASNPRQPLALIAARRFLGQLDVTEGRLDEAAEHLKASLGLADRCEAPFERALTLLEMARLNVATERVGAARRQLNEIREICEPLGAKPTLDRVAELEAELVAIDD